jgi:hypothetical protein
LECSSRGRLEAGSCVCARSLSLPQQVVYQWEGWSMFGVRVVFAPLHRPMVPGGSSHALTTALPGDGDGGAATALDATMMDGAGCRPSRRPYMAERKCSKGGDRGCEQQVGGGSRAKPHCLGLGQEWTRRDGPEQRPSNRLPVLVLCPCCAYGMVWYRQGCRRGSRDNAQNGSWVGWLVDRRVRGWEWELGGISRAAVHLDRHARARNAGLGRARGT